MIGWTARLIVVSTVFGTTAWAAETSVPATMPTRDVDVTYATPRPGAPAGTPPLTERFRWSVAEGKQRVDLPTSGVYVITDFRAHRLQTVSERERKVLVMNAAEAGISAGPAAGGNTYQRRGEDEVAGLGCTLWETGDTSGRPAVVCLTPDGVTLRATGAGRVLLEAIRVSYGAVGLEAFRIPDGFELVDAPSPVPVRR